MELIDFLNDYFRQNNIRQKDIIKATGISQDKISLILSKKRKLSADELILIANKFDINLEHLKKNQEKL